MFGALAIFKKDYASFFRSWVGILVLFAFLLMTGIFFTLFLLGYSQLSVQAAGRAYQGIEGLSFTAFVLGAFYLNLGVIFLFLTPLLSMRAVSEERRFGTLELLYTFPLSDFEIVLGKYLALTATLATLFFPTSVYLLLIRFLGPQLEWGVIFSGISGFFFLGAMFLAVGLFFSSLTQNQIVAAGSTFTLLLGVWILEWLADFFPEPWSGWLGNLSPFAHYRDFPLGIFDFTDAAFFAGAIAFFFFLTLRVVESRTWKN